MVSWLPCQNAQHIPPQKAVLNWQEGGMLTGWKEKTLHGQQCILKHCWTLLY